MKKNIFQKYLWEFVYWGIDGSITTFAIVSWSVGANLDSGIIVILGFANLLADGFAMSVWSYLSSGAKGIQVSKSEQLYRATVTFFAFLLLGFIPLIIYVLQYFWVDFSNAFLFSSILTLSSFAIIWYIKSFISNTSHIKSISETMFLWIAAASLAYYIGDLLEKII
jgi:VIT1/CCC1 family predicted Fe2+/Mn2+ transporter